MSNTVLTEEERRAAFAGTAPKFARSTIVWTIVACLAFGFGGIIVDHFFNGASKVGTTPLPTENTPPPLKTTPAEPASVKAVPSTIGALMGLTATSGAKAPGFSLEDGAGGQLSLSSLKGRVVVLGFFNSTCADICPVLSHEFTRASHLLSSEGLGGKVAFLVVNTNPLALAPGDSKLARTELAPSGGRFVTGPLKRIDPVWKAYGITIEVAQHGNILSHTDLLYFIDKTGHLATKATPVANEVKNGTFELAPSTLDKYARGIADEAGFLAKEKGLSR